MVVFFDRYDDADDILTETLARMHGECKAIVLEDRGFWPEGFTSLYEYYILQKETKTLQPYDLHYAFLEIPEFCNIKLDGYTSGAIFDMGKEIGTIYSREPFEERFVGIVEWCSESNYTYRRDYYNKYGFCYCTEYCYKDGSTESKTYYTSKHQKVLHVNYSNGVVTLFENGEVRYLYSSLQDFKVAVMKEIIESENGVGFTSAAQVEDVQKAGTFFDKNVLLIARDEKSVVDFREKELTKSLQCPMLIFENFATVMYEAACENNEYKICYQPKEYPQANGNPDILILTASDDLCEIENLIDYLPRARFHIAANTMVSIKLENLARRENVYVYPQISETDLKRLLANCEFYLDINAGREIFRALIKANRNGMLILGFKNRIHNPAYLLEECIYEEEHALELAEQIKLLMQDKGKVTDMLMRQRRKVAETMERFERC